MYVGGENELGDSWGQRIIVVGLLEQVSWGSCGQRTWCLNSWFHRCTFWQDLDYNGVTGQLRYIHWTKSQNCFLSFIRTFSSTHFPALRLSSESNDLQRVWLEGMFPALFSHFIPSTSEAVGTPNYKVSQFLVFMPKVPSSWNALPVAEITHFTYPLCPSLRASTSMKTSKDSLIWVQGFHA